MQDIQDTVSDFARTGDGHSIREPRFRMANAAQQAQGTAALARLRSSAPRPLLRMPVKVHRTPVADGDANGPSLHAACGDDDLMSQQQQAALPIADADAGDGRPRVRRTPEPGPLPDIDGPRTPTVTVRKSSHSLLVSDDLSFARTQEQIRKFFETS